VLILNNYDIKRIPLYPERLVRTQGSISIQRHMQMLLSGIKGSQFHYTIYTTIQPISNWEGPEAMAYPIQLSPFRI
jgi:hypothetical protein